MLEAETIEHNLQHLCDVLESSDKILSGRLEHDLTSDDMPNDTQVRLKPEQSIPSFSSFRRDFGIFISTTFLHVGFVLTTLVYIFTLILSVCLLIFNVLLIRIIYTDLKFWAFVSSNCLMNWLNKKDFWKAWLIRLKRTKNLERQKQPLD